MVELTTIPDAKLAARVYRIDLHRRIAHALSRPARQWRNQCCARKRTDLQPHCQPSEASSLAVCKFCTAGEECCK